MRTLRKTIAVVAAITFLSFIAVATNTRATAAQNNIASTLAPTARNLGLFAPDSPLYSFQRLGEWLRLNLTFNSLERAKYELSLIERRAEELRDLAERGRLTVERAQDFQHRTEQLIRRVRERTERAAERGLNIEDIAVRMQTILERQHTALREASERVPTQTQNAIRRAIEVSRAGKERVIDLINRLRLPVPAIQ